MTRKLKCGVSDERCCGHGAADLVEVSAVTPNELTRIRCNECGREWIEAAYMGAPPSGGGGRDPRADSTGA